MNKIVREVRRPVERFLARPAGKLVNRSMGTAVRFMHAAKRKGASGRGQRLALYRILGNELKGRHGTGQTLENLEFTLKNEATFPACEKVWVLNRISDPRLLAEITALLRREGQKFQTEEFVPAEYARIRDEEKARTSGLIRDEAYGKLNEKSKIQFRLSLARKRCLYAMNINGARNAAISAGVANADWVLPWDGNCFITQAGWAALSQSLRDNEAFDYHIVPMVRLLKNGEVLAPGFKPLCTEEPQIVFGRDAVERFDERLSYGRRDKTELLSHLGVPGPWEDLTREAWDLPARPRSPHKHLFNAPAGWVARLAAGTEETEWGMSQRHHARAQAILEFIDRLDQSL